MNLGSVLLALGLAFLPSLLGARATAARVRFAWFSDLHVGTPTAERDLREAVAAVNATTGVDFVVVSGDLAEVGSRSWLLRAKELLGELEVPVHVVPGNHDSKWSESGGGDVARVFGHDRFCFERGAVRFVGLPSGPVLRMGPGHFAPGDVRWLERRLARLRHPDRPLVFVSHYPLDGGVANWYAVLDLLKRHGVRAVLCGHGHKDHRLNFEGVPGVMGRTTLQEHGEPGGFNLVEVAGGAITFTSCLRGRPARRPWHKLPLSGPVSAPGAGRDWPRPSFARNAQFPDVRAVWKREVGSTITGAPALWRDLAVVGDASGLLQGLTLATGATRWRFRAGGPLYATPEVAGDLVVAACADGNVYAVRAADGRRAWRHATGWPLVAAPRAAGGLVYVGSCDGWFRALDLATGRLRWQFCGVGEYVETKPLVADGAVFFGAWDQHFYALDASTGGLRWRWHGDRAGTMFSPAACWPVAARGSVYVAAPDRQLTALDAASGRQVWRSGALDVRESLGLSEDGSRLYVRTMKGLLAALATGCDRPKVLWELDADFGADVSPAQLVEKEGMLFYGTGKGLLLAVDGPTGDLRWRHRVGVAALNTVAPLDRQRVLVTDCDGRVALVGAARR